MEQLRWIMMEKGWCSGIIPLTPKVEINSNDQKSFTMSEAFFCSYTVTLKQIDAGMSCGGDYADGGKRVS